MAGSAFSNLASSAKGIFTDGAAEKAVLYIYLIDLSQKIYQSQFEGEIVDLRNFEKDLIKKTRETAKITDTLTGMGADIKNYFTKGSRSGDKVGTLVDSGLGQESLFVKYEFQYNPASMRIYSVNGKVQERNSNAGGVDKLSVMDFSGKSKLSFDIIFDDCDNMNAFMVNDLVNTNLTGAVNKGINVLQHGGNTYSVRKRMDAIMSLLSSPATQQVIFYWSKMVFRGTITDVQNTFTMFNPQGNPIRGTMHLEITQDKALSEMRFMEGTWSYAFKQVFKEPEGGMGGDLVAGIAGGQSKLDMFTNNPFLNI